MYEAVKFFERHWIGGKNQFCVVKHTHRRARMRDRGYTYTHKHTVTLSPWSTLKNEHH